MVDKIIFSLQVIFLGFGVVMVVLFALYGLSLLLNLFTTAPVKGKQEGPLPKAGTENPVLSPQQAAAIAAAVSYHRRLHSAGTSSPRPKGAAVPGRGASRWSDAGRRDLMEKSLQLEFLRRQRT